MARSLDLQAFPYIKPYGPRFDRNELPYFKYRETLRLKLLNEVTGDGDGADAGPWEVSVVGETNQKKITISVSSWYFPCQEKYFSKQGKGK